MSIFAQGSFFQENPAMTPEQLERKREAIRAVMNGTTRPRYAGEGWMNLGKSVVGAIAGQRLDKIEDEKRKEATDAFSGLFGGGFGSPRISSSGGPTGGDGGRNAALARNGGPTTGAADEMRVRQGLIDRGLPEHVADGFLMNFRDESGLNPGINERNPIVPGSRGGFGLAQWTGPRRKGLEAFARQRGTDVSDLDTQLDYLMTELQGPERQAANAIFSAKNPGEAGAAIVNEFLRPAEEHRQRRTSQYLGGGSYDQLPAYNGPSQNELMQAMQNPWLTPSQRQQIGAMMTQAQQATDPLRQLEYVQAQQQIRQNELAMQPKQMSELERIQLEQARLNLEQDRAPQSPTFTPLTDEQEEQMGLPSQGVWGLDKDGRPQQVYMPEGENPSDRFKVAGGTLFDIGAEGGPKPVGQGQGQETVVMGPDGQPVYIQGPAGTSNRFTEGQSKDNVYSTRARGALEAFEPVAGSLTSRTERMAEGVPFGLARGVQSDDFQVAQQAGTEFLQAILRKDTGAAITTDETESYGRVYLPQPGDGEAVLAAKREARVRAINAIEAGMTPAQMLAQDRALIMSAAESGSDIPERTKQRQGMTPPPSTAYPTRDNGKPDFAGMSDEQFEAYLLEQSE